jgi:hypothetical protein
MRYRPGVSSNIYTAGDLFVENQNHPRTADLRPSPPTSSVANRHTRLLFSSLLLWKDK